MFGGEGYADLSDALPLMVANAGNSERSAISSLDCPPFISVELCREHIVCHIKIKLFAAMYSFREGQRM